MQTIEITNPGEPVTGMIRAVKEDSSSTPTRWTVTVVKLAGQA